MTSCTPVSFSRRTVLHGVSKYASKFENGYSTQNDLQYMACWVLPCVSGLSTKTIPFFSSHFRFSQLDWQAFRGTTGIAIGQLHAPSASHQGKDPPVPIRGWVSPRNSLDISEESLLSLPGIQPPDRLVTPLTELTRSSPSVRNIRS